MRRAYHLGTIAHLFGVRPWEWYDSRFYVQDAVSLLNAADDYERSMKED